jgi:hypothetical protein
MRGLLGDVHFTLAIPRFERKGAAQIGSVELGAVHQRLLKLRPAQARSG